MKRRKIEKHVSKRFRITYNKDEHLIRNKFIRLITLDQQLWIIINNKYNFSMIVAYVPHTEFRCSVQNSDELRCFYSCFFNILIRFRARKRLKSIRDTRKVLAYYLDEEIIFLIPVLTNIVVGYLPMSLYT